MREDPFWVWALPFHGLESHTEWIHLSLLPDCRHNVISCFIFLLPCLLSRDRLYSLKLWRKKKNFLSSFCKLLLLLIFWSGIFSQQWKKKKNKHRLKSSVDRSLVLLALWNVNCAPEGSSKGRQEERADSAMTGHRWLTGQVTGC